MLIRIVSGAIGLAAFVGVVIAPPIFLQIALAIISAVGIYEILKAYSIRKYIPLLIFSMGTPFILAFFKEYILIYAFLLAVTACATMLAKHESFSSKDLSASIFYTAIVSIAFSVIGIMRTAEHGIWLICIPFAAAWSTDTFAYFTGKFLGKHKLCEKLSPKKTIEGAVGGIIGAVIVITVYIHLSPLNINLFLCAGFAVIASILSQMGDIFASCIKREQGIKDFGNLMPGHGGVMDRFDSITFTAPFTCLCLSLINFI